MLRGRPWRDAAPGQRPGQLGADQLRVVTDAIASLPPDWRAGHGADDDPTDVRHRIVVRADSTGAVADLIDGLVARNIEFSVFEQAGHPLAQSPRDADRWIAATAIRLGLPLVSHDAVFRDAPGLNLETALEP